MQIFHYQNAFKLECGIELQSYHLGYTTLGKLNEAKSNVVWIFHALTANSNPAEWWPGLVGENKFFDPKDYFIVCVNMPGSYYGSSGPLELNPDTAEPWYHDFPLFTTRDMIRAYKPLKEYLGIEKVFIGIGGSMGGQQLLEWAIEEPEVFENIFPIATNAVHSPWGIAFNTTQRMCIEADNTWKERKPEAGIEGMKAARAIALISYRNYETYQRFQSKVLPSPAGEGAGGAASYQRYQGEKLVRRFNAFSYYRLSQAMDSHNVGRERESIGNALQKITANVMVIAITSDILFPHSEQKYIADNIPGAIYKEIASLYGHDGFLLEFEQIENIIREFLFQNNKSKINLKAAR